MAKMKRTSLEAILADTVKEVPPPASPVAPAADGGGPRPEHASAGERPRLRTFEARHKKLSAYLSDPVYEQLRQLAHVERHKKHDYLMEGLDSVFRQRGLPSIAELEKEDA